MIVPSVAAALAQNWFVFIKLPFALHTLTVLLELDEFPDCLASAA
jgi:hypothetical protein